MMNRIAARITGLGLLLAVGAAGCAHVGQDDFDAEIAAIRGEIAQGDERVATQLGQRIDGVEERTAQLEARMNSLEGELRMLEEEFDVTVERLEASLRFNTPIHFGFDEDEIPTGQTALLERFASVVNQHYPNALVTVEGFTDPAGSEAYNLALGQRRADAVRSWLVGDGAMVGERVRAVSYGEDTSRLVRAGATGPGQEGQMNRRVVFVIDHSEAPRAMVTESQQSGGTS
jgi:peptidoglycan-associated lipoprotein